MDTSSSSGQEASAVEESVLANNITDPNPPQPEQDKPKAETPKPRLEAELPAPSKRDRHAVLESLGLKVGKTLGHGSYASVKSATDAKRKEEVAIKIVSRRRAPSDYLSKFLPRELDVLKILQHESLIRFYQVIETTNRFYIVMELAENGDLLDAIRSRVYVDEYLARIWFRQLYEGIVYIHSKGVAHRDIKCENLLLTKQNAIKITDFGFAKQVYPLNSEKELYSETFCGSYAYAAPEILRGVPYDPFLSEVWSMGVVLFTMVFGRLPYDDSDLRRLLKQVQSPVSFPAQPAVSDQCKSLIQKILVHKLGKRTVLEEIPQNDWFGINLPEPQTDPNEENQQQSQDQVTSDKVTPPVAEGSAPPVVEGSAPPATEVTE